MSLPLPLLDEVDVSSALSRCGGDAAVLVKLMRRFVQERADFAQQFRLLYTNDQRGAQRIAHSLRGLSGNLGMSELSAHATELERLVEAAAPLAQVEQALDRLESARLSLFGRITCWLDQLP